MVTVIAEFEDFAILEDCNGRFLFHASGEIEEAILH